MMDLSEQDAERFATERIHRRVAELTRWQQAFIQAAIDRMAKRRGHGYWCR